MPLVTIRTVTEADLPILFEHQIDREANIMAAFTVDDPKSRADFDKRWTRLLADNTVLKYVILVDEQVVGHLIHFKQFGKPSVGYWLARSAWGQGIASAALYQFLQKIKTRPLYARAARDNYGSVRVLEKCGFVRFDEEMAYANARGHEIAEVLLILA